MTLRGWTTTTLGDVLPLAYGKALPKEARAAGTVPVYGSSGVVGKHSTPLTGGPTLIVGRKGNVGEAHLSMVPCWPIDTVYFAEGVPSTDLRFFYYLLQFRDLRRLDRSTAVPGLGRDDYGRVEIGLPPQQEQQRIVDAIDSYLTRIDEAVASLERVQANLKAYRASVLKAAVEGRLVPTEASLARAEKRDYEPADVLLSRILKERRRRWEEAELAKLKAAGKTPKDDSWKAKYKEPVPPDTGGLGALPEGWCWATVDQLSRSVFYGSSAKASENGEVPVIRMGNIVDGGLDLTELKFLPSAHEEFPGLLLQSGDLLFNRTNSAELVGKTAIYHGVPTPCSFASYLICVRVLDDVESGWICHAINSLYGRLWISSVVTQQVGQANVNGTKLKAFPVPLPPLPEQRRLLSLMDELFSKSEVVHASGGIELRRASRLRQSILRWAFEGNLVDQDPNDEPAERLLARIRAERTAPAPTEKTGGRRARGAA